MHIGQEPKCKFWGEVRIEPLTFWTQMRCPNQLCHSSGFILLRARANHFFFKKKPDFTRAQPKEPRKNTTKCEKISHSLRSRAKTPGFSTFSTFRSRACQKIRARFARAQNFCQPRQFHSPAQVGLFASEPASPGSTPSKM